MSCMFSLNFGGVGGQGGEGRSNPRSLKGRDAHVFFCFIDSERTGENKSKKKKINRKSLFSRTVEIQS